MTNSKNLNISNSLMTSNVKTKIAIHLNQLINKTHKQIVCKNKTNYKELLDKNDIDAVIITSTDFWHSRITKDALSKGKAVYCEKPMVYKISQGPDVIEAQQKSGKVLQVGSQRVSSIGLAKAKEL